MDKVTITCKCNEEIDITKHPLVATCPVCGQRYQRQANKMMLLDREEVFCPGAVIV